MGRLRPRLTYANVIATVALFFALGGGAYAAFSLPRASVGTAQLKSQAVTAAKVKRNALGGVQINEATLGKVPSAGNADALGGAPASAYQRALAGGCEGSGVQGVAANGAVQCGNMRRIGIRRVLDAGQTNVALIEVPGIARMTVPSCAGTLFVRLDNISGSLTDGWAANGSYLAPGWTNSSSVTHYNSAASWRIGHGSGAGARNYDFYVSWYVAGNKCLFQGGVDITSV